MGMTINELTKHLGVIEDNIRTALSGSIAEIKVPFNINIGLEIDLIDATECGSNNREYIIGNVKLRPSFSD